MTSQPTYDTTQFDCIKKNQNGVDITDTLIISKDRTIVRQYRNKQWKDLNIGSDKRFRYQVEGKSSKLSLKQVNEILQKQTQSVIPEGLQVCDTYRGKDIKPILYRKAVRTSPDGFIEHAYYQDQGLGLRPLPCIGIPRDTIKVQCGKSCIEEPKITNDQESIYFGCLHDIEEAQDKYILMMNGKKNEIILYNLDIEYNLIPEQPPNLTQLTGHFMDEYKNMITFNKRPLYHDLKYEHWYQKFEGGWHHEHYTDKYSFVKILDDNGKWKYTIDDIEHLRNRDSPPQAIDDQPQKWREYHGITGFTKDKYVMITQINDHMIVGETLLWWEMPSDNEPIGRFIGQQNKDRLFKDLCVKNGKVEVFTNWNFRQQRYLDVISFFKDVFPIMHPDVSDQLKKIKRYPINEVKELSLWDEEEQELELPYLGWKSSLLDHPNRPRMKAWRRLCEEEDFEMMGFDDKSKKLKEETLKIMKK
jgi:hypothetical protein